MPIVWQPHLNLDLSLIPIIQRAIDRISPAHLEPPADGELFDISNEAYERLQNYAFSQGFQIVIGFCEVGRKNYSCIHHKADTKNYRKLDDHASKDGSTNRKQKLTKIKAKDCKWRCFISYRSLDRSDENKTWVLRVRDQTHNHDVVVNSLSYDTHKKRQPKQAKAIELTKTNRLSKLIYRASERVLENILKDYDQKFHLFKKQYYNLISSITRFKEEIITELLQCLDNSMFIVRIRYFYTLNDADASVQKNIKQIFLLNNYQRRLSKRFISDFMMKTDAIFNINALKMLLFVTVNVTNTAMIFSACFSFVISESE